MSLLFDRFGAYACRMDFQATSMNSFEAYCPRENNTAGSRRGHVEKPPKRWKGTKVPGSGSPAIKKCQVRGMFALPGARAKKREI